MFPYASGWIVPPPPAIAAEVKVTGELGCHPTPPPLTKSPGDPDDWSNATRGSSFCPVLPPPVLPPPVLPPPVLPDPVLPDPVLPPPALPDPVLPPPALPPP